jgi:hypothetical protein
MFFFGAKLYNFFGGLVTYGKTYGESKNTFKNLFGQAPEHVWASGLGLRIIEENKEFSGSYTGLKSKTNRWKVFYGWHIGHFMLTYLYTSPSPIRDLVAW